MTKLNKTETEKLAKEQARKNETVLAKTIDQLLSTSWEARGMEARQLAETSVGVAVAVAGVTQQYRQAYEDAFAGEAQSIWASKMKQRENAIRAFRSACSGLTHTEAKKKIGAIVNSFNLRGVRLESQGYHEGQFSSVEVTRGNASATLYVQFDRDDERHVNPLDGNHWVSKYHVALEISWGGYSRSIDETVVSVRLYQDLLELASEIKSTMDRENVIYVYGGPEVKDVNASSGFPMTEEGGR